MHDNWSNVKDLQVLLLWKLFKVWPKELLTLNIRNMVPRTGADVIAIYQNVW